MNGAKLSQRLESALEFTEIEIPNYIYENLSKELRVYQEQALKHYLLQRKNPKTNHLMFNMATGSGKTLMMAALMLDLYVRGYRDFVFFVGSTAIVKKTKANFTDKTSSKYLFKERILFDSSEVEINVIENLSESKEKCINIYFSTTQGLFSLFKEEKENDLSLEDFQERKIVFLADEGHHLNSDTKKKLGKKEKELKEGWETITRKAFESHPENLMLEFTATIPDDVNVREKYRDKIIYEYDLSKFCKDGYSKRIFLMKYENQDLQKRFLGALISSLFRELLAQKYEIVLKPVVMFKSEAIKLSKENERLFIEFLENLDSEVVESFYQGIDLKDSELFAKSLEFFKKEFGEIYAETIVGYLQNNFKPIYILNTNDENELKKNQILLNSLEDSSNEIRVIFSVDKLNEGWDVLNLFDIVRLGSKKSDSVTTNEVQLIGRGARYYPFESKKFEFDPELAYKRKFDSDLENELSMLERLIYHTINDMDNFIENLNEEMLKQGLLIEELEHKIELIPNQEVLDKLKDNKVFYAKNHRIRKRDLGLFRISKEEIAKKMPILKIPLFSSNIEEKEERFEESEEKEELKGFAKITDKIESKYFLKAMNMLGLSFASLKENFDLASKDEFIKKYLGDITFEFAKKQKFDPTNNLKIAFFILEHLKSVKEKIKMEYEVRPFSSGLFSVSPRVIFSSNVSKFKEMENYKWLFYRKCSIDSNLEKSFLDFIESKKDEIDAKFSTWFVVRNDGFEEFKLYDNRKDTNTYGYGFEPDFIFFGKRRGEDKNFLSVECFMEAKGEYLAGSDGQTGIDVWKEKFLESLQNEKVETEDKEHLSFPFLPFFSKTNDGSKRFLEYFEKFIEH